MDNVSASTSRKVGVIIWWIVQINAVLWFVAIGIIMHADSPSSHVAVMALGLLAAALLEFVGYKHVYKVMRTKTVKVDQEGQSR